METNVSTTIDIIIPTYANINQLQQCIDSMYMTYYAQPFRLIVVNNGDTPLEGLIDKRCLCINNERNEGWAGGLLIGLRQSRSEYVVFANDDIYIPRSSLHWLRDMVRLMQVYDSIGAVGPQSNCAMGVQSIWSGINGRFIHVPFLIGFCMVVRRSALDGSGGVDASWETGDDIDLSIRMRQKGHKMVVLNETFVYHHGFQTGIPLFGDHTKPGGWNSREMSDATNVRLIQEHGFMVWWGTMCNVDLSGELPGNDEEGDIVRSLCNSYDIGDIIEVGCGENPTIDGTVTIDQKEGLGTYQADAINLPADNSQYSVLIGRHILEHMIDPIEAFNEWTRVLRKGGKMILACPDERLGDTIPMDPTHKHAFTPASLCRLAEICGLKVEDVMTNYNGVSFIVILEKEI